MANSSFKFGFKLSDANVKKKKKKKKNDEHDFLNSDSSYLMRMLKKKKKKKNDELDFLNLCRFYMINVFRYPRVILFSSKTLK